jgi:hypothetical protein
MIHGHKPNGYYVTATGEGHKIEGESRQCVHCQFTWEYHPGSGIRRGYCLNCDGFLCGRDQCAFEQKRLTEAYLQDTGKVRSCMPFEEWNSRVREKVEKYLPLDPNYTITESGLIVPK